MSDWLVIVVAVVVIFWLIYALVSPKPRRHGSGDGGVAGWTGSDDSCSGDGDGGGD